VIASGIIEMVASLQGLVIVTVIGIYDVTASADPTTVTSCSQ